VFAALDATVRTQLVLLKLRASKRAAEENERVRDRLSDLAEEYSRCDDASLKEKMMAEMKRVRRQAASGPDGLAAIASHLESVLGEIENGETLSKSDKALLVACGEHALVTEPHWQADASGEYHPVPCPVSSFVFAIGIAVKTIRKAEAELRRTEDAQAELQRAEVILNAHSSDVYLKAYTATQKAVDHALKRLMTTRQMAEKKNGHGLPRRLRMSSAPEFRASRGEWPGQNCTPLIAKRSQKFF
jgi:hypothetical protein